MKAITVISSEEFNDQTSLFLSNGHEVSFPTSNLIDFIESEKLNVTDTYGGNSGSGEPWNDLDSIEQTEDASAYLDREWDKVTRDYYQYVILKGE